MARIRGTSGDGRLTGTAEAHLILGLAGNDRLHGGDSDDCLRGGGGDEVLDGGDGTDRLEGGNGDDLLLGGEGSGVVLGGGGNDEIRAVLRDFSDDAVTMRAADGTDMLVLPGHDAEPTSRSVLHAGAGSGRITVVGIHNPGVDGGSGDDIIQLTPV